MLVPGCATFDPPTPQELAIGCVWIVPGIEGSGGYLGPAVRGMRDGGVTGAIRVFEWTNLAGPLANLADVRRSRTLAAKLAAEITAHAAAQPTARRALVGYSGGAGLAVFAVEALPPGVTVDRLILVHGALSPTYDLARAFAHVRGDICNLHSAGDWWTLGWGTRVFGTMDRAFTAAAGKDGFVPETAVKDAALRARLRQICWDETARAMGHDGMHLGMLGYEWNRRCVAPLLME